MMFAGWRLRLTRPTKAVPVGPVSDAPPGFFLLPLPRRKILNLTRPVCRI